MNFYIPILSDYLIDIICIPLVLGWMKWWMDKLAVQNFQWGIIPILIAVIYFSLVFEVVMPSFSSAYTRDYWDIFFYFFGGFIFHFSLQKSSATSPHPSSD